MNGGLVVYDPYGNRQLQPSYGPNYYNLFSSVLTELADRGGTAIRQSAERGIDNARYAYKQYGAYKFRPRGYTDGQSVDPPTPPDSSRKRKAENSFSENDMAKRKISKKAKKTLKKMAKSAKKYYKKVRKSMKRGRTRKHYSVRKAGYVGTKFRKYSKRPDRNVIHLKAECGGIIQDNNCVYVGHGVPVQEATSHIFRSVLKEAFQSCGIEVQNIERDPVVDGGDTGFTHALITEYIPNASSRISVSINTALSNGDTLIQATDKWLASLASSFNTNVFTGSKPMLVRLRYVCTGVTNSAEKKFIFSKNLQFVNVQFEHTSYLKIQNITLPGQTAVATGEDIANSQNIESVVLTGRIYKPSEWRNHFEINRRGFTANADVYQGFFCRNEGMILQTADVLLGSSPPEDRFKKPPQPWEIGCKRAAKVVVEPGKIYRDKIYFKTTIGLNTFLEKVCDSIKQNQFENRVNMFGTVHMLALEKMLDFRLQDHGIEVGYEVDFHMKAKAIYRVPPTSPQIKINTGVINYPPAPT